jgi:ATP-dependent RNA helicase DDX5/DBP2
VESESEESNMNSMTAEDARNYRKQHDVRIKGFSGDMNELAPMSSFDDMPFSPALVRSMLDQGFSEPTAIQAQSWPIALMKRDMISIARTGSGKTCAFLLPCLHAISQSQSSSTPSSYEQGRDSFRRRQRSRRIPKALVLAPTRELAQQIEREASKLCPAVGVTAACFYGGASKGPQLRQLSHGVDIVVATPGRCNDLIEMGALDLSEVDYLVLDEADRMLDMGFEPQIRRIVPCCKPTRQSLFFTATWPKGVQELALEYLADPITINIGDQDKLHANKAITQHIHMVKPHEKYEKLEELLEKLTMEATERTQRLLTDSTAGKLLTDLDGHTEVAPEVRFHPKNIPKTLIFVGKKAECDDVAYDIQDAGYTVGTLHGDKSQDARSFIMQQFRRNNIKILVATDVAARGLDITDIECVINFDFPPGKTSGIENYVHRIGRTARGNRTGIAHSFFTPADAHMAKDLIGILERAGQEVPHELRALNNPRRANAKSNYGGKSSEGKRSRENFDLIGGTRGRSGRGERSGGFKSRHSSDNTFLRSNSYDRAGGEDSYDDDGDTFYRSGGFRVGSKKFSGNAPHPAAKKRSNRPKYKSIFDDDDYF